MGRIVHERVYAVKVEQSLGRFAIRVPNLPWSTVTFTENEALAEWAHYAETQGRGFVWDLDLEAGTLTRRIVLPVE